MWMFAAVGSAFFAGVTALLAKLGIRQTDSDVATALRTIVVLAFSWLMAGITGQLGALGSISITSWVFLALSGLATGASWICYFKALSIGDVNKVVPIDKTSSVLTILLAIALFGETNALPLKLACSVIILVGTLLMVDRKSQTTVDNPLANTNHIQGNILNHTHPRTYDNTYLFYAIGSAVFAALTSILAKVGITDVPSNLATAVRTCFVLVMAWIIVTMRHKLSQARLSELDRRELCFLTLSGITTGASWLCYYFAVQQGVVSVVVPIDKLSILVSMGFAATVLHEKYTKRSLIGLTLITLATLAMALWA
jgi:transporter family protein